MVDRKMLPLKLSVKKEEINKQEHPSAAKVCSNICPRTLSAPRSEQFSESVA